LTYLITHQDAQSKLLFTKWLRAVNTQEYRLSVLHCMDALNNSKVYYWLIDITRIFSPAMNDQKWTTELIGPAICHTLLKKIAVVIPDDLFLEVVAEKMGEEVLRLCDDQVKIAYFRHYEQALNWLQISLDPDQVFRQDTLSKGD
jgi:hypothetical protein